MSTLPLPNPMAPPVYSGIPDGAPPGYVDIAFDYTYDRVLTALQALTNETISINQDADFEWRGTVINFATGAFLVRFYDSQGFALSNGLIASANIVGDAASPSPMLPPIMIPAGGRISLDIVDISNAGNTIQIVFRGVKRYRIGQA